METICDLAGLEELPEVAATGLRNRGRNQQGNGNFNCQGQNATCGLTCGITSAANG
ncbi:MAG: hypothetical protein ACRDSR_08250 [Pseudonocardiaceae bacterium]